MPYASHDCHFVAFCNPHLLTLFVSLTIFIAIGSLALFYLCRDCRRSGCHRRSEEISQRRDPRADRGPLHRLARWRSGRVVGQSRRGLSATRTGTSFVALSCLFEPRPQLTSCQLPVRSLVTITYLYVLSVMSYVAVTLMRTRVFLLASSRRTACAVHACVDARSGGEDRDYLPVPPPLKRIHKKVRFIRVR